MCSSLSSEWAEFLVNPLYTLSLCKNPDGSEAGSQASHSDGAELCVFVPGSHWVSSAPLMFELGELRHLFGVSNGNNRT